MSQEVHDGKSSIIVQLDGQYKTHSLDHLFDNAVIISDFRFEDGRVEEITISIRPTNHVYSRAVEEYEDLESLKQTGSLLYKYEHEEGNPHKPKLDSHGNKIVSTDIRAFCLDKYLSSHNIPTFIEALQRSPAQICVRANRADERTCLTGLFEFEHGPEEKHCYVVLFKLHKLSVKHLSMIIETAFMVDADDFRVNSLKSSDAKPFLVVLKNVFAKRQPFQGQEVRRSKKRYKKEKKARQAKSQK